MIEKDLQRLGDKITRLRIAKNLKQSDLAYEAGISERTLQRIEAGEVVKSDGLLRVIAYLGKLEDMLSAIDTPSVSPYEIIRNTAGRALKRKRKTGQFIGEATVSRPHRSRVRHNDNKRGARLTAVGTVKTPGKIIWPEDQT